VIEIPSSALVLLYAAAFLLGFAGGVALWLIDRASKRPRPPRSPSPPWGGT
jgi:hypothetical protein